MIKLQIVGNLGKDCIVKEVNGKNVINFSVVHSEKYKDNQGNPKERATWVECAYWTDKTAVAPYLTRGKTVYAEGYPEADAYMNKDNQPTGTLRMRVVSLQLIGGTGGENPRQDAGQGSGTAANSGAYASTPAKSVPMASSPVADDLPF
ncbi:MAG: single-stranded DNA-binding protein [Ferruginibacter sp.]